MIVGNAGFKKPASHVFGGNENPNTVTLEAYTENMESPFSLIRDKARQIASRSPSPDFHTDFSKAVHLSRQYFDTNPVVLKPRAFAEKMLENDFGHGLNHAVKVSLDAGTLILVESALAGQSEAFALRRLMIVQCAGLLHDIKRKETDHAIKGAEYAAKILTSGLFSKKKNPFTKSEIEDIRLAINNHEAFKTVRKIDTPEGLLVSDCLYDADKFRWGPDNFTDTVWEMVAYSGISLPRFVAFYPRGMESLARIKSTFRTPTGKKYGPQFVDIGIAIGEEVFRFIQSEFPDIA